MADKISTRQAYGDALVELGAENKNIIVFAPRMPKTSYLKDNNSKRELAGNTIEIEGWTLYNSKSFAEYM